MVEEDGAGIVLTVVFVVVSEALETVYKEDSVKLSVVVEELLSLDKVLVGIGVVDPRDFKELVVLKAVVTSREEVFKVEVTKAVVGLVVKLVETAGLVVVVVVVVVKLVV